MKFLAGALDPTAAFYSFDLAIYFLLKSVGKNVLVCEQGMFTDAAPDRSNTVVCMFETPYEEYVYDLTTHNHHFQAGIGNIIVHNTDSIFVELGEEICPMDGLDEATVLAKAQEVGEMISASITTHFRAPNDLEYEKTFKPFL